MADTSEEERPSYERALTEAPPTIVQDGRFMYGCYSTAPRRVNMLDIERPYHYSVPRWVKYIRCKEWRAFHFGDKRWFFYTTLYDAKTFGLALFSAYDRARGRVFEMRKALPFLDFSIGDGLDGQNAAYKDRNSHIAYSIDFASDSVHVTVDHSPKRCGKNFSGNFSFSSVSKQGTPSSVCLPLGLNRAMYSTRAFMSMEGWFIADGERFDFSTADSMGVLDDHKGYYPYRMQYDWASGFGQDSKGRKVGFNLTDNQVKDQYVYNENVLWINNRLFPLPPIKVTRPNGYEKPWHIQDTEGLVDILFKPERRNSIHLNLFLASIDYHGPLGCFEGVLRSPDGSEKVDVEGLFGMAERNCIKA